MDFSIKDVKTRCWEESGFTLMEIMVCLAILGITFAAALKATIGIQELLLSNQFHCRASILGANKMNEIRLSGPEKITIWRGQFDSYPQYHWKLDKTTAQLENLELVILKIYRESEENDSLVFKELFLEKKTKSTN